MNAIRSLSCFLLLGLSGLTFAADWVVTEGGLSPDKRLSVCVFPQKTEFVDEADGTVLLVNNKTGKPIGPLEEADSTGGTWGKTTTNVFCSWSEDSSLLVVSFRTGRLMNSFQVYKVTALRAIPLKLPDIRSHPKAKILNVLGYNANYGETAHVTKDGHIVVVRYGFMPKEGHWDEDYSKFGLKGFDALGGSLRFIYSFNAQAKLQLDAVTLDRDEK